MTTFLVHNGGAKHRRFRLCDEPLYMCRAAKKCSTRTHTVQRKMGSTRTSRRVQTMPHVAYLSKMTSDLLNSAVQEMQRKPSSQGLSYDGLPQRARGLEAGLPGCSLFLKGVEVVSTWKS